MDVGDFQGGLQISNIECHLEMRQSRRVRH
jgi:hypothetical protein